MAASLQQRIRYRKLTYTALIAALFLGALLHKQFVILPEARALQLREVDRGEVELTGSALRLLLTGSRGLAVTYLWNDFIEKQKRHRWNEMELLVNSITELQPHFITPWLFQSWNLAFNVAGENDRPRDKYYYVSRGLERLAAGERRNDRPGNPDLRQHMAMYLQMKIGNSDEKMTMRSYLELSAMDPLERDPKRFAGSGGQIHHDRFREFCHAHPRLVRRLHDQLGYNAADIVNFLSDNRDLPGRFHGPETTTLEGKSVLKDPAEQWPVLPSKRPKRYAWPGDWPDATQPDFALSRDPFDVFLLTRTWNIYAQESVPPPHPHPYASPPPPLDKRNERIPRRPALLHFRALPARAQFYIAESLQEEGWFDDQGWFIKDWFRNLDSLDKRMVGEKPKYHSGLAFARAFDFYVKLGKENGMYLDPEQLMKLNKDAEEVRNHPATRLPPHKRPAGLDHLKEQFFAHHKLSGSRAARDFINFDVFFAESRAKSTPEAVAALKLFALAEGFRQKPAPVVVEFYERNEAQQVEEKAVPLLELYDRAAELWLGVLLNSPLLRKAQTAQEHSYDLQLKLIRYFQKEKWDMLLKLGARTWPLQLEPGFAGLGACGRDATFNLYATRFKYFRDFRGPFDMVKTIDLVRTPDRMRTLGGIEDELEQELKMRLLGWSTCGKPWLAWHPSLQPLQLAVVAPRDPPPEKGAKLVADSGVWRPLLDDRAIATVRNRYRGLQPQPTPKSQAHPAGTP